MDARPEGRAPSCVRLAYWRLGQPPVDRAGGVRPNRTWDRLADICASYLGKGMTVALEGRIQTRQWDDDRGAHHWRTEIVASAVEMLSGRRKKDYAADALAVQANALGVQAAAQADDEDDDEAEPGVAPGDPEPEAAVLAA